MSSGFHALGNNYIGTGTFGDFRLSHSRHRGKPTDTPALKSRYKPLWVQSHDRGDNCRIGLQDCVALGVEVRSREIACSQWHFRTPIPQESAHGFLRQRVALHWRIRYPEIELEAAIGGRLGVPHPTF